MIVFNARKQMISTGKVFLATDDIEDTWHYIGFIKSKFYNNTRYHKASDDMTVDFDSLRFILSDILKMALKGN